MAVKNICVIEIGEGWAVRREGELMLVSVHDTVAEAENAALRVAQREGVEVLVQGRDGRYRRVVPKPLSASKPALATAGRKGGPRGSGSRPSTGTARAASRR